MAEASIFKSGMQLKFAKAHHKNHIEKKSGCGPGLGELSKIWKFPFNIYTMAEAIDFKFGKQLGFAKAHHKVALRGEVGVALCYGSSPKFGIPL